MAFKHLAKNENLTFVRRVLCATILYAFLLPVLSLSLPLNTSAGPLKPRFDTIPSVAVNKYFNSGTSADSVELLVIQNNLDMRGMIIKDFSSSMANDTGGKFTFADTPLWNAVPAGTLIVLRNDSTAADVTVGGGDYNLDVGLTNPTYFSNGGGTFDIATVEMVMIKSAGSGVAGVTGSIHALAGGTAGAQFTSAPTPKLIATGSSGSNQFVFANNSTQSIADFNGTDATGAATGLTFGAGNNANNTAFINSLRGGSPSPTPTPTGTPTPTPTPTPSPTPPPVHDPSEHLVMGNPTGAVTDVNTPLNYLMMKTQYALSYNNGKATTNWTSWHLDSSWLGGAARTNDFRSDDTLPPSFVHVSSGFNFATYGFDRGHMCPSADRTDSTPSNSATFYMTNMIPQASGNNQGPWGNLEDYIRTQLSGSQNEEYIISGPWGIGGNSSTGHWDTIQDTAGNTVTVPQFTWKVIMVLPNAGGDDVARVTNSTRTFAVIMPNNDNIRSDDWRKYLATVSQVEVLTGYTFFSNVPVNIQTVIKSEVDDVNDTAPVATNQTVTTAQNTPKSITLAATDFNVNNVLTYSVVSIPQHGSLIGTPPNLTYTPDSNFSGPDSFNFVANDGAKNSNTATVTISVTTAPTPTPTPSPSPTPSVTPTPTPTPQTTGTVSGRVVGSDLRGLRNGTVSMTDANNVVRTATTSSFGFFSFDNVVLGQQYTFRVSSRFYRYSSQIVTVDSAAFTLPDFVGLE